MTDRTQRLLRTVSSGIRRRCALAMLAMLAGTVLLPCAAQAAPATDAEALHLLNRLGYGPAPNDLARVKRIGVDRYIDEQLDPERIPLPPRLVRQLEALASPKLSQRELIDQFREAARAAKDGNDDGAAARKALYRRLTIEAGEARLLRAIESPRQLQEVMVDFWFNHFNVFEGKGLDRALVENYEREAIRPYAMGRFRDLLGATAHHPAMLFYLDNWLSSAPGFQPRAGAQAQQAGGLNENYARELMELHTLGADGGYTQQDVTELARMLTGWSFNPRHTAGDSVFYFDARRHDSGSKTWLGRSVADAGQTEGEAALDVLAASPATARHISRELAQYFVADQPPPKLVDRLTRRYLDSGGDIRAVLHTLFDSPEFRDPAVRSAKFKTPYHYVISAVRAADVQVVNVQPLMRTLYALGMPLYGCQTPDGYKNTEEAWLNTEALSRRIAFATALAAGKLPLDREPDDEAGVATAPVQAQLRAPANAATPVEAGVVLATLGPGISPRTQATVEHADPALQAAMLLGSPDFMRR